MRGASFAILFSAFAALAVVPNDARAQEVVVEVEAPPPAYIATATPVYHEGHAAYWYNGHWHYRGANGRWMYYRAEPTYLRQQRDRVVVQRYHYRR